MYSMERLKNNIQLAGAAGVLDGRHRGRRHPGPGGERLPAVRDQDVRPPLQGILMLLKSTK